MRPLFKFMRDRNRSPAEVYDLLEVLESRAELFAAVKDPGTIEHILPESPGDDWEEEFPVGIQDRNVNRIGNLTLLEAGLNREVGNASYDDKVGVYRRSRYALTRTVVETAPQEWTPALLEKRQRELAARAVHIWRSDFA